MLTQKERRLRAKEVEKTLDTLYPDALCALEYEKDPWKLLVMGRLSAQCTDKRVNAVSKTLFEKYPDCVSMANGDINEIEKIVYPCGVYKVKAKNIRDFSAIISEKYGGKVPNTMDELLTLPGIGRKIANLILGDIYRASGAIVCDTHCIRIANRLELADSFTPEKVEKQLREVLNPETSSDFCHRIVLFGRDICSARSPKCDACPLKYMNCKKDTAK